jgi:hypothetical protein
VNMSGISILVKYIWISTIVGYVGVSECDFCI